MAETEQTDPPLSRHALTCFGVNDSLVRMGDKWSLLIVLALRRGTLRFGALKRLASGISQRMLTLTLRNLERDGFVKRSDHATVPPWVDYELTALGRSLSEPVEVLGMWAIAHEGEIASARRAFDGRSPLSKA